ncbi:MULTISPECIES: DUF6114 domain-containing protein [unclassified Streptomyces]|uniref:DUF6114 domain-containing protein n=1 Tax=unclassified Streptomyces TaxID=2593676 RepID=UPI000BACE6E7|nr:MULTISPECIES: DUF6114 domain-containing protein [unclassified Streptomyces]ASY32715.1 hypothetical protein CAC01_08430 [Streptomyces sp. CLI2509]MYX19998.1 hypothetical protein [Streptomyces sp. SID8380]
MSAESPGLSDDRLHVWRTRFRDWRGTRPFWAGVLTLLGGIPIAYIPYNDLKLGQLTVRMSTTAGAGSLIIGVLLITLGLTMWYQAQVRVFAGVAAILLALVSLPVSNFGGFVVGFLLALFGGSLALAWVPDKKGPYGKRTEADYPAGDPSGDPAPEDRGGPDVGPGPELPRQPGPAGDDAPAGDGGRPFAHLADGGGHRAE